MAKAEHTTNKSMEFRGIGESEYITDFKIGIIPVIKEDDPDEIKLKKRLFIRKKLGGMRQLHMIP